MFFFCLSISSYLLTIKPTSEPLVVKKKRNTFLLAHVQNTGTVAVFLSILVLADVKYDEISVSLPIHVILSRAI